MIKRLGFALLLLSGTAALSGCVVAPGPGPGPGPRAAYGRWVPGHYNWNGRWIPGHYA